MNRIYLAVGSYYSAIVCTNTSKINHGDLVQHIGNIIKVYELGPTYTETPSGILLIGLTTEIIHNWTRNNLS